MSPTEYMKNAVKTDLANKYPAAIERLQDRRTVRLLHMSLGLGTEMGEVQDVLKKHIMYGKPIDVVNLKEEVGDVLWYLSNMLEELGCSFEEVMATNIAKLKARFPDGFSEENALKRNLEAERQILEEGSVQ